MRRLGSVLMVLGLATAAGAAERGIELSGYAEWREGGFLIVDGQRVTPAPGMRFEGKAAARFSSIPLGYEVKVRGSRQRDGSVLASSVQAKPNGSAFSEGAVLASANEMEHEYRKLGRVAELDERGRVVEDVGRLLERGPEVDRVRRIVDRIAPPYWDRENLREYVVDNREWNAMAAPNGSIYAYRGLLRDLDDDEVAIVLGHELAHVTHEHSRKGYKSSLIASLIAMGASAAAGSIDNDGARLATRIGISAGSLALMNGYGRAAEDQADRVGLRYAYEGGYDVRKGPALWKKFEAKYHGLPKALNVFLGSHSVASARARNLEEQIRFNYADSANARFRR